VRPAKAQRSAERTTVGWDRRDELKDNPCDGHVAFPKSFSLTP
jgi:hypothetical protein